MSGPSWPDTQGGARTIGAFSRQVERLTMSADRIATALEGIDQSLSLITLLAGVANGNLGGPQGQDELRAVAAALLREQVELGAEQTDRRNDG